MEKKLETTIMGYLRADAVPPTPKKRGRRRLTALEVLQAKSAFCRSQSIFLRLAVPGKDLRAVRKQRRVHRFHPLGD